MLFVNQCTGFIPSFYMSLPRSPLNRYFLRWRVIDWDHGSTDRQFETVKARCRTIQYKCEISWPWFNFISFQKFNFWWFGGGIYSGYQHVTPRKQNSRLVRERKRFQHSRAGLAGRTWSAFVRCPPPSTPVLLRPPSSHNGRSSPVTPVPEYQRRFGDRLVICLLYTSDAADE